MLNILNLGAGRQSSYLYHASGRGILPKLDCAIFADTGWERKVTYEHLEWLKREWEPEYGIPIHVVSAGDLRNEAITFQKGKLVDGKFKRQDTDGRWASMPLRVLNNDGSEGMINRQCTKEYKIEPIEKFIKTELLGLAPDARWPKERVVRQWFGISCDEWTRMSKPMIKRNKQKVIGNDLFGEEVKQKVPSPRPVRWRSNVYYLCNTEWVWNGDKCERINLGVKQMTADECVQWHLDNGLPEPPGSACVGCPYRDNKSWREVREVPEEWSDVTEFDGEMRDCAGMNGKIFLHRDLVPLEEANLDDDKDQPLFGCDEGWCESPN